MEKIIFSKKKKCEQFTYIIWLYLPGLGKYLVNFSIGIWYDSVFVLQ